MAQVILSFSMSLDGYAAGPNVGMETPMGEGGERLHDWMMRESKHAVDAEAVREVFATTGAVVLGRRTFDLGIDHWKDVPFPAPSFVLTHRAHERLAQKSGAFDFITDGIESAVTKARAAAGDRNVIVMGADTAQQTLKAGLADRLSLQIVPVLMGGGVRLFDRLGADGTELELVRQVQSPQVMHLQYRVLK